MSDSKRSSANQVQIDLHDVLTSEGHSADKLKTVKI